VPTLPGCHGCRYPNSTACAELAALLLGGVFRWCCSQSTGAASSPLRCPPAKYVSYLSVRARSLNCVRTRDDIDAELRLLIAVRQSIRDQGDSSGRQIDELLDEWGMTADG